jgi:50S ribosomal protein L16 3-hydroxylase
LSLGKRVFCNGEEVSKNQSADLVSAWQTLSARKSIQAKKLKNVAKTSLYEAYLAGWLIFEP